MSARITITAGTGFDRDGRALSAQRVAQALATIRATLAQTFGGYTETDTLGGWVDGSGELVTEPGKRWTVVEVEEMAGLDSTRAAGWYVAGRIAAELGQASVLLEVEPVAVAAFVEPQTVEV